MNRPQECHRFATARAIGLPSGNTLHFVEEPGDGSFTRKQGAIANDTEG